MSTNNQGKTKETNMRSSLKATVNELTSKQTAIVSITCLMAWLKGLSRPVPIVLKILSMWLLCLIKHSSDSIAGFTQSMSMAWGRKK